MGAAIKKVWVCLPLLMSSTAYGRIYPEGEAAADTCVWIDVEYIGSFVWPWRIRLDTGGYRDISLLTTKDGIVYQISGNVAEYLQRSQEGKR